jgi:N-acetylglutamate synthase-like GNAT family acetyltransferase
MEIEIIEYQPLYAKEFERLNISWLEKYFVVEPYDAKVLANPDEFIIAQNGRILLARQGDKIVGTVALMYHGEQIEVTKMAVDEKAQGQGIGKMLMQKAIDEARKMQPEKIFLLTSSKLQTANAIYEKFGFLLMPLEPDDNTIYARCDRRWELPLEADSKAIA